MDPLLATQVANAASGFVTTGINAWTQSQANKSQRQWSEKMYDTQKKDAEAQWHMQNEYNSPASQMQRLEAAGLNPNLVYGKGADNISSPVRGSSPGSYSPKAPTVDLQKPFSDYQNFRIGQAQADNLKVQNTVLLQEAALKAAQISNIGVSTAKSSLELNALKETSMDVARESLRKLAAEADISDITRTNLGQQKGLDIQNAAQELLLKKVQTANSEAERERINQAIESIKKDNTLKQLDIDLKKNGVQPGDQIYFRVLSRVLKNFGISL